MILFFHSYFDSDSSGQRANDCAHYNFCTFDFPVRFVVVFAFAFVHLSLLLSCICCFLLYKCVYSYFFFIYFNNSNSYYLLVICAVCMVHFHMWTKKKYTVLHLWNAMYRFIWNKVSINFERWKFVFFSINSVKDREREELKSSIFIETTPILNIDSIEKKSHIFRIIDFFLWHFSSLAGGHNSFRAYNEHLYLLVWWRTFVTTTDLNPNSQFQLFFSIEHKFNA